MVAKIDAQPPSKPSSLTPPTGLTGITGRTPDVPPDTQTPIDVTMRPIEHQVSDAGDAARELNNADVYRADFGKYAPDPVVLVMLLVQAKAYSEEAARAQAWLDYLVGQRDRTWHQALATMTKFKPHFDLADSCDPNIATRYFATKSMLSARAAVVARANVTRRKNRIAKRSVTPA